GGRDEVVGLHFRAVEDRERLAGEVHHDGGIEHRRDLAEHLFTDLKGRAFGRVPVRPRSLGLRRFPAVLGFRLGAFLLLLGTPLPLLLRLVGCAGLGRGGSLSGRVGFGAFFGFRVIGGVTRFLRRRFERRLARRRGFGYGFVGSATAVRLRAVAL